MPTFKKRTRHFSPEERAAIEHALRLMVLDGSYNTEPSYSSNADRYPDNLIPFIDKHMMYLITHPGLDPQHYIANLRLMTRLRR